MSVGEQGEVVGCGCLEVTGTLLLQEGSLVIYRRLLSDHLHCVDCLLHGTGGWGKGANLKVVVSFPEFSFHLLKPRTRVATLQDQGLIGVGYTLRLTLHEVSYPLQANPI